MSIRSTIRGCIAAAAVVAMTHAVGQPLQEISIALSSQSFGTAGARIAQEMGLFQKHGLTAKFVVMDSSNVATTALISRSLNFAMSGPGELVAAQARGQKVVVIANAYSGFGASLVLSKAVAEKLRVSPTAPVSERLKALDGLLIGGVSATSIGTVTLKNAAKAAGANVRFAYMAQPAMAAALESGALQGYWSSAPFWAPPIINGSGVLWLSGPKGDFPAEYTTTTTAELQVMRDFADANPELMRRVKAVFSDLAKAVDERPAEVKAAVAKLYPNLDAKTLDLLFASESLGWKAKPPTAKDIAHEIALVKSTGVQLPQIDSIDPGSMIVP